MEVESVTRHIVSFSGGKDSTAMLLMMLERGMQVDGSPEPLIRGGSFRRCTIIGTMSKNTPDAKSRW